MTARGADIESIFRRKIRVTSIVDDLLKQKNIRLDMLRLDLIHPQISGNKWFKLKYSVQEAQLLKCAAILSFGGAYSNHLHALAYVSKQIGIPTIGIVRGEKVQNPTLNDCVNWGMQLQFVSRNDYKLRNDLSYLHKLRQQFSNTLIIPEGGNNEAGRKGCLDILQHVDLRMYTHICSPVGSGATLNGLIESSLSTNKILGFSAMKNAYDIEETVKQFTTKNNWQIIHDYHFGGFAKTTDELAQFMQKFEQQQHIELDKVYTAKMCFGLYTMIQKEQIPLGSSLLILHTGGLQGNRS